MVIYKITNKINGKAYIGQTVGKPEDRWKGHRSPKSGAGRSAIKKAIIKYGSENFSFEVLEKAENKDQLNSLEIQYIQELNTLAPNGYNLKTGGSSGGHHEESRKKISEVQKGRTPWNKGLTADKDSRVESYVRRGRDSHAFGKALHNMPHSEETKRKISEIQKGKITSEETKKRISDAHRKHSVICNETGQVFKSIMEASRVMKINSGNICRVLKGMANMANGFTFRKVS